MTVITATFSGSTFLDQLIIISLFAISVIFTIIALKKRTKNFKYLASALWVITVIIFFLAFLGIGPASFTQQPPQFSTIELASAHSDACTELRNQYNCTINGLDGVSKQLRGSSYTLRQLCDFTGQTSSQQCLQSCGC